MSAHRDRLNEIAKQHGMPHLSGGFSPTGYLEYAMDLTLLGLGLLKADEIKPPIDVYEEWAARAAYAAAQKKRWWK